MPRPVLLLLQLQTEEELLEDGAAHVLVEVAMVAAAVVVVVEVVVVGQEEILQAGQRPGPINQVLRAVNSSNKSKQDNSVRSQRNRKESTNHENIITVLT